MDESKMRKIQLLARQMKNSDTLDLRMKMSGEEKTAERGRTAGLRLERLNSSARHQNKPGSLGPKGRGRDGPLAAANSITVADPLSSNLRILSRPRLYHLRYLSIGLAVRGGRCTGELWVGRRSFRRMLREKNEIIILPTFISASTFLFVVTRLLQPVMHFVI